MLLYYQTFITHLGFQLSIRKPPESLTLTSRFHLILLVVNSSDSVSKVSYEGLVIQQHINQSENWVRDF